MWMDVPAFVGSFYLIVFVSIKHAAPRFWPLKFLCTDLCIGISIPILVQIWVGRGGIRQLTFLSFSFKFSTTLAGTQQTSVKTLAGKATKHPPQFNVPFKSLHHNNSQQRWQNETDRIIVIVIKYKHQNTLIIKHLRWQSSNPIYSRWHRLPTKWQTQATRLPQSSKSTNYTAYSEPLTIVVSSKPLPFRILVLLPRNAQTLHSLLQMERCRRSRKTTMKTSFLLRSVFHYVVQHCPSFVLSLEPNVRIASLSIRHRTASWILVRTTLLSRTREPTAVLRRWYVVLIPFEERIVAVVMMILPLPLTNVWGVQKVRPSQNLSSHFWERLYYLHLSICSTPYPSNLGLEPMDWRLMMNRHIIIEKLDVSYIRDFSTHKAGCLTVFLA